ncbi:MAG TPA: TIGR03619 family F420-dependent LLM class oxidoreductase [candidate division Zixibacteria bacterium]|nr:TIGR03619 family F420-dependent LLM class oxidoreductase [candidate division Zixibacteria bacterium]
MRFGVLLPHFGKQASRSRIIDGACMCEELGFDSVWVRDHLLWNPHGMERSDLTFIEPFVTLSAVAAVTRRIVLGTAVLVPLRWPLKLCQDLASLSFLAGGRVIAGMGLGFNPPELAAVGLRGEDRAEILRETVAIARRVWTENDVTYRGRLFSFENVTLEPKPVEPIPIFYGGSTRASIRRAAEYCDGWIPGRVPLATFDDRVSYLRRLTDRKIVLGNIPITRIERDRKRARADIDVRALAESSEGSSRWIRPPSGKFQTIEDLEGLLIVGDPDDCAAEIEKFRVRGVEHLVFDLRLQYDRFEESLELIGKELLPRFPAPAP